MTDTPNASVTRYRARTFLVLLGGMTFLGMSITVPAVAWPTVSDDLGLPLAQLGFVSLAYGTGYTIATLLVGSLSRRFTTGRILVASATVGVAAMTFVALTPGWWAFLAGLFVLGTVGGSTDGTANTWVAIRRGTGSMGLLHAAFGVGAIMGPLVVSGLVAAGASWRLAFLVLASGQLLYVGGLSLWGRRADVPRQSAARGEGGLRFTRQLFWSLAVFFVYAGVGGGAAIWAFTFLTEHRAYGAGVGGIIVAAYWGGFTASRFALGWVGDRVDPNRILSWSAGATIVWFSVFWLSPEPWVAVVALIAAGFSHGPVFPLEILLTPRRFGTGHTANVVGFEIAAANIGGAILPAIIGALVAVWGLAVVPPAIIIFAVALLVCVEMLRRSAPSATDQVTRTSLATEPS